MKVFIFLLCTTFFGFTTENSFSQENITIDKDQLVTVNQLFKIIKQQTDYRFIYPKKIFENSPKVQLKKGEIEVIKLLKQSLSSENLSFELTESNVILIEKNVVISNNEQLQQKEISGTVVDNDGMPLPGASVVIKGTSQGTETDFDGKFSLILDDDAISLVISFVGFATQEIEINDQNVFTIQLVAETSSLDEVVLIGYGSVAKKDLTGAVTTAKNISGRSVTHVAEAMQGNIAGVTVVSDGGDPTSVPVVRIRGIGTTSAESPLWIVDGVPYYGGPLNPFDIATMSILKDASATAIYGVRAAGGVIIVTTKKGRDGDFVIDFNTYVGAQNVWNKPKALNAAQQAEYYNIAADNSGFSRDPAHDASLNPDGQITRTNWVDEIFRTGLLQNYDIGVRGGSEKISYRSSIGYNKREGTLINTDASRISVSLNTDYQLTNKLKIGENFTYTKTNGNSAFTGTQASNGETNYNGIIAQAIKAPPHLTVYDENGNYSNMPDSGYGLTIHPVSTLNRINVDNPVTNLFANIYFDYDILDNLKFRSSYGVNLKTESYTNFDPRVPEVSKTQKTTNFLQVANRKQTDWSFENTITYNKTFADVHTLTLLGGITQQSFYREETSIIGKDLPSEDKNSRYLVNATSFEKPTSSVEENKLSSYYGRINYVYDHKYLVTASVRRDGTSKLSKDNRWGTFPSLALAWRVSKEDFLADSKTFSNLKLRTSWGRIGNISSLSNYPTNVPLSETRVILGAPAQISGFALDGISNPDIAWETTEQLNFGLDMSMFDHSLSLTADYFIKNTNDLILPLPISSLAGVSNAPFVNSGKVRNKGVELTLSYEKTKGDLHYVISGNISKIDNELVELGNDITKILDNTQVATHFPIESVIGEPIFSFYLLESDGIFQSNADASAYTAQPNAVAGDLRFKDQNNDGLINDDDKVYKGNAFPDLTFGFNFNLDYKRFDLALLVQGVSGSKAYNGFRLTTTYPAQTSVAGANLSADALNTWYSGNTSGTNFRLSLDDPNDNLRASDYWLENSDYVRVKSLAIGYTFPEIKHISRLRAYVSAQNLITVTNYSGLDPEVSNKGIDGGQYPVSRIFTFGINLSL